LKDTFFHKKGTWVGGGDGKPPGKPIEDGGGMVVVWKVGVEGAGGGN